MKSIPYTSNRICNTALLVVAIILALSIPTRATSQSQGQSCCLIGGDANTDGSFNIADVTFGIARIFSGGPAPVCPEESDANADNTFNIADVTFGIARIFSGGPAPMCPGPLVPVDSATYTVTFESTWSATTHPDNFPANAHFSGLIGGTHDSTVTFWQSGELATLGIKSVAEFGSKFALTNEVVAAQTAGSAEYLLSGGFISPSPGTVSYTFDITSNYPLVTLITMIAPSPDWFVGVHDLALYNGGQWTDTLVVELFAYDSGTDDGVTYTSPNAVTSPPAVISQIALVPFLVGPSIPALGSFTFVKQ